MTYCDKSVLAIYCSDETCKICEARRVEEIVEKAGLEELFDIICSECGILEDKRKQDLIREYGRREREKAIEDCIEALPKKRSTHPELLGMMEVERNVAYNACLSEAQQALKKLK